MGTSVLHCIYEASLLELPRIAVFNSSNKDEYSPIALRGREHEALPPRYGFLLGAFTNGQGSVPKLDASVSTSVCLVAEHSPHFDMTGCEQVAPC